MGGDGGNGWEWGVGGGDVGSCRTFVVELGGVWGVGCGQSASQCAQQARPDEGCVVP